MNLHNIGVLQSTQYNYHRRVNKETLRIENQKIRLNTMIEYSFLF